MNIREASERIKTIQNQIKTDKPDNKSFHAVSSVADKFMEMLSDNFPVETDAIALLTNFQEVAIKTNDTDMFLMLTGILMMLHTVPEQQPETLH